MEAAPVCRHSNRPKLSLSLQRGPDSKRRAAFLQWFYYVPSVWSGSSRHSAIGNSLCKHLFHIAQHMLDTEMRLRLLQGILAHLLAQG